MLKDITTKNKSKSKEKNGEINFQSVKENYLYCFQSLQQWQ